ncbi:MAG TPA: DUF4336 domain-containing protein [Steroidobacteraceae bacterium]|nr:DUF4336 domain-containing protein [Steroidobacteraceae bacterium]
MATIARHSSTRMLASLQRGREGSYPKPMLLSFGPDLYIADGPAVSFFGFPYPTRMAIARLSTGKLWVWSPTALTRELASAVEAIGTVGHIVSPNKLHHLFLAEWKNHWPDARLYAPPGLARKVKHLHFDAELGNYPDSSWMTDIDQVVFTGSPFMEEVVFFHRASCTAIFGDLIQRFPDTAAYGWKGLLMRHAGIVGQHGSTPRDWRVSFLSRTAARQARRTVLAWKPEQLLIAHGACATSCASEIIETALGWI